MIRILVKQVDKQKKKREQQQQQQKQERLSKGHEGKGRERAAAPLGDGVGGGVMEGDAHVGVTAAVMRASKGEKEGMLCGVGNGVVAGVDHVVRD